LSLGLLLSLLIGVALGLFGGGGSMLAVPTLVYVMGLPPTTAIFGSLVLVGATSAVALLHHLRAGLVEQRTGLPFGAGSMLGAYGGGRLTHFVPDALLLGAFGVMMSVAALLMLRGNSSTSSNPTGAERAPTSRLLLYGLVVGFVSGLLGAGGGFLIVPTLALLGPMPLRRAVGTSLLVITLQSFAGICAHLGHTDIPIRVIVPFTLLAAIGSSFGSSLASRLSPVTLRRGFASLVLGVALVMMGYQSSRLASSPAAYVGSVLTR
jgi:uncharacterized membrane protein YfcA